MSNMRLIGKDETFSPTATVDGRKVHVKFAVSPSADDKKNGTRYEVAATLDFEGVTEQQLLELVVSPVVIDTQRRFRVAYAENANAALDANTWKTINVLEDVINATRRPRTIDPLGAIHRAAKEGNAELLAAMKKALDEAIAADRAKAKAAKAA